MACNSKPFASPSMSPKIDEKKKKKTFCLLDTTLSLFLFGFSRRIGPHDETNLNS